MFLISLRLEMLVTIKIFFSHLKTMNIHVSSVCSFQGWFLSQKPLPSLHVTKKGKIMCLFAWNTLSISSWLSEACFTKLVVVSPQQPLIVLFIFKCSRNVSFSVAVFIFRSGSLVLCVKKRSVLLRMNTESLFSSNAISRTFDSRVRCEHFVFS